MSESHQEALQYLIIAIGLVFLAIMVPLLIKIFRKKELSSSNTIEPIASSSLAEDKEVVLPVSFKDLPAHLKATGLENSVGSAEGTPLPGKPANLQGALKNTEENIFGRIRKLFTGSSTVNMEAIEEILYTSDLGPKTVQKLMSRLEENFSFKDKDSLEKIRQILKSEMSLMFEESLGQSSLSEDSLFAKIKWAAEGPTVIMIVGVNGAGKTTSIGKISAQLAAQGKKVLVAAGDTFRAAAEKQLKVWTERAQVEIFSPAGVQDPAAVAYEAVSRAKAHGCEIVIIDTAGRLHTQVNLMEELKKVKRVMSKLIPEAPHEVLIVLDANSGQNALVQAQQFHEALTLTGAILTKMDGTAKGGVAVGLAYELKIPIKLMGVGEKIQDLRPFSHQEFVDSIFPS